MKKQKRNLQNRAYIRGYRAGMAGKSKALSSQCQLRSRPEWLAGWREGREDMWDGLNPVAGTFKTIASH